MKTHTHAQTTPACSLHCVAVTLPPSLPPSFPRSPAPSHTGFFDHVAPPVNVPNPDGRVSTDPPFNFTRLGVRVPAVCTHAAFATTAPPPPLPLSFPHTARPRCCCCCYYCHCHCHCRCLRPASCTYNLTILMLPLPLLLHHCRSLLRLGWTPALSFTSLQLVQEGPSATLPSLPPYARCSHPMHHS